MHVNISHRHNAGNALRMTVTKILATNAIVDPVFFFPTFYTMREVLNVPCFADVDPITCARLALAKYRDNCLEDWRNSWVIK